MQSQQQTGNKKILDVVREVMRLHHYSIHTERSYSEWIRRFALYHHMQSREDIVNGGTENRSLPHAFGRGQERLLLNPEPSHECLCFSLQKSIA